MPNPDLTGVPDSHCCSYNKLKILIISTKETSWAPDSKNWEREKNKVRSGFLECRIRIRNCALCSPLGPMRLAEGTESGFNFGSGSVFICIRIRNFRSQYKFTLINQLIHSSLDSSQVHSAIVQSHGSRSATVQSHGSRSATVQYHGSGSATVQSPGCNEGL